MGTTWKACQIHAPGPSSDALMQHPGRWTGDCNSPSEVPLGAGPEAVLEEALPPLRTKHQFHLPRSLLVWGFSSGTPLLPTRAVCARTVCQRILSAGACSSHGLIEDSHGQNRPMEALPSHRFRVYTRSLAPSHSLPPLPGAGQPALT